MSFCFSAVRKPVPNAGVRGKRKTPDLHEAVTYFRPISRKPNFSKRKFLTMESFGPVFQVPGLGEHSHPDGPDFLLPPKRLSPKRVFTSKLFDGKKNHRVHLL